jgi:hypothetical protein
MGIAVTSAGTSLALAAEPTISNPSLDLAKEIQDLRSRLDDLQAKQRQQEVQNTYDDVLRDADARSAPLLQTTSPAVAITSGYENGKFFIASPDKKFSFSPFLQIQFRNTTNALDTDANGEDSWTGENGFELRRAKFGFNGNVFSKALTYEFLVDVPRNSGTATLQFAWLKYQIDDAWAIRLGQFKDPLGKEQLGSSTKLLAAERSLLSDLLIGGDNPVQGGSIIYGSAASPFRIETAFTDGSGQLNTNFRDISGTTPDTRPDFGAASRAELQLSGNKFKGYDDYTAYKYTENTPLFVLGAGGDITQLGDSNQFIYTADALFKNKHGFGAFGAILGRYTTEFNSGTTAAPVLDDVNDIGFVVQASQLIGRWSKADWEIFGRYDYTQLADERVSDPYDPEIHEITVGTNAYFQGHNVKGTVDFTYLPNGSPVTSDGNGVLQSTDAQFVIRAQFQLVI